MILHMKYQGSRHCGFRQDFFYVSLYAYIKHVTLEHKGHILNNLVRSLLGDATYQISSSMTRGSRLEYL